MKLLRDTCIWGGAADVLRMSGHDVIRSGDWDEDPGDEKILAMALAQDRVLITLDKGFGELRDYGTKTSGQPHGYESKVAPDQEHHGSHHG